MSEPSKGEMHEALIVWMLRRWRDGALGRSEVWSVFGHRLGPREGAAAVAALESLEQALLCADCPFRRLESGSTRCCDDEILLAEAVCAAARGDLGRACACMSPRFPNHEDVGPALDSAARLGRAVRRMAQTRAALH